MALSQSPRLAPRTPWFSLICCRPRTPTRTVSTGGRYSTRCCEACPCQIFTRSSAWRCRTRFDSLKGVLDTPSASRPPPTLAEPLPPAKPPPAAERPQPKVAETLPAAEPLPVAEATAVAEATPRSPEVARPKKTPEKFLQLRMLYDHRPRRWSGLQKVVSRNLALFASPTVTLKRSRKRQPCLAYLFAPPNESRWRS